MQTATQKNMFAAASAGRAKLSIRHLRNPSIDVDLTNLIVAMLTFFDSMNFGNAALKR